MLDASRTSTSLDHLRIITQKELRILVPYTPQHVLRLEKAGKFPRRLQLGQNRIGWRLIDIEAWIDHRTPAQSYRADSEALHQSEDASDSIQR